MWWLWIWLAWGWAAPVVTPGGVGAVELSDDTESVAATALAVLRAGQYADAARQLGALADAGDDPELRFLEAVALYEAGLPRASLAAVVRSLDRDPSRADALALHGLLLADLGRGDEGIEVLSRTVEIADVPQITARAWLFRATIHADRGEEVLESRALASAAEAARTAGDHTLLAEVEAQQQSVADHRPADLVGSVSERLRRGDRDGARRLAAGAEASSLRDELRRALALAAIARSDGSLDVAHASLTQVVDRARGAGLLRELVAAQVELARTAALAGRLDEAQAVLAAAWTDVAGTSLRVRAFDVIVASGRLAARRRDASRAGESLAAAEALAAELAHPDVPPQVAELRAAVLELTGDPASADQAWASAAGHWATTGRRVDEARVRTARVRLAAAAGLDLAARVRDAEATFAALGDALGPAHVAVAEGLGHVEAKALDHALAAFARGRDTARSIDGARARSVGAVAESNAAEALTVLGHTGAVDAGSADLVARHTTFQRARAAYEEGRVAFDARRFDEAVAAFTRVIADAGTLGEADLLRQARHARGWALWNASLARPDDQALPAFEEVAEVARAVGDQELVVRAVVSASTASARLKRPGAAASLERAADLAEAAGLAELAARCLADRGGLGDDLDVRASAVQRALALHDGRDSWYAAYSLGFDAYAVDRYDVALAVLGAVDGRVWELAGEVDRLLQDVRASTSR